MIVWCSSSVIHHLEENCRSDPYSILGYFYFTFTDDKKQNTENMLRSLIVQLCGGRPDTPKSLLKLQSSTKERNLQPSLKELEETLKASMQGFKKIYVVLDALDECPLIAGERHKLMNVLECVHRWGVAELHVLYTSRDRTCATLFQPGMYNHRSPGATSRCR